MLCDLLVHVDGSQAGRRRVEFAIDLAARTGARLDGLHVTPPVDPLPLYKPSVLPQVEKAIAAELAADAHAAASIFGEATAKRLPDARWFEATGDIAAGICARARYADMVIVGQYERPPYRAPVSVGLNCSDSPGKTIGEAVKTIAVTETTCFRWRLSFVGRVSL